MSATVTTTYGKLDGEEQDGLSIFRGIPFAAAPVGARRWMPPEKPAAWSGVRDARKFAAAAPQNRVLLETLAAMKIDEPQDEDCLYLNVWTPAADNKRRPVMVWIHGGGFTIGAGSQRIYDGSVLARRGDTVVVTVNYRLGPLGFLRLNDVTNGKIPSTGNEGMLDQVASLEWVRDNIAQFGGDPENVTIFGESAGGMSVGTLLAMPAAAGLFHKAIPQSGSCSTGAPTQRANRVAERVLSKSAVASTDVDAMRAIPARQMLKALIGPDGVTPDPEFGMGYQPVIDGTVLPKVALELVAEGSARNVAVMVGSTLEEWKLFSAIDPSVQKLDKAGLGARIGRRLTPETADTLIATYEKARAQRGQDTSAPELFSAIETDRIFRMPAVRLAETQNPLQPKTYNYLFTHASPAMRGALGSCHALELGFIFGTNHLPGMTSFAGSGPEVEKLATDIQDAWFAFARTGSPATEGIGQWPAYDDAKRATMIFNANSKAENDPYSEERRAWDNAPNKILGSL